MAHRIEVRGKNIDARAFSFIDIAKGLGFDIQKAEILDIYSTDKTFSNEQLDLVGEMLINPVTESYSVDIPTKIDGYGFAFEIGFLPGVTDNVANTTKEGIEDLLKVKFEEGEGLYSSRLFFVKGNINEKDVRKVALNFYNPLIERMTLKSEDDYGREGMGITLPQVKLSTERTIDKVNLDVSDDGLIAIGKKGIENSDGSRRGPLALDLESMRAIKEYFEKEGRNPTDIELESIAQTWSEHCKHTIFAASIDEIKDGLYKEYIKKATNEIRKRKCEDDICVSVFIDNSGAIVFDDDYLVTDKVETHNSPSALDPFGGSITGIVGVNRDTIGFGKGAKPVINRYGFCFADPRDEKPLYKGENGKDKMLSPKRIMDGVIEGVEVGGNCSGIPTPQGFIYFDERYKGKPLVFVGTVGLIPREVKGENSCEKKAKDGDLVVMVGGRVGADGIHGATFSSEAMDSGSPATAVQIGDPITQKKLSDAIVKEARDEGLYNSITDNGAGGLSCSVAEMAKESGGFLVDLEKIPLKYPGLSPWETWVSESQERMTLSIPKDKWQEFEKLMKKRGVEATVLGEFNNSGRCIVKSGGKDIMNLDIDFLHDGLPEKELKTSYTKKEHKEPEILEPKDLDKALHEMLKRPNITSFEFISSQYDHEVQGGSVLKPLQGEGRVNGNVSITRPRLDSKKGVVISQGLYPSYSDIDTYHMAASSIDTAIRNAVSAGADIEKIALLDNFCWCSSDEEERLGQLKAAVQACYDTATEFGTPFISGKDSMFNDFKGYNEKNEPVKISVPPTLLISSIGVVEDVEKTVDMVPKMSGDLVYLVGDTRDEMGGSEYYAYLGFIGNNVPKVDPKKAKEIYEKMHKAISEDLISSSLSIINGGLGVALAKKAIAGRKGIDIDISSIKGVDQDDSLLFSESQSRFVVTIDPDRRNEFEKIMKDQAILLGKITDDNQFTVRGLGGEEIINEEVSDLEKSYKETLKDY